jgi:hypothetical protein
LLATLQIVAEGLIVGNDKPRRQRKEKQKQGDEKIYQTKGHQNDGDQKNQDRKGQANAFWRCEEFGHKKTPFPQYSVFKRSLTAWM